MSLIMRTWRHQALFGRVDGLYSRQMLIKSLGEQKLLTTSLEKMMTGPYDRFNHTFNTKR